MAFPFASDAHLRKTVELTTDCVRVEFTGYRFVEGENRTMARPESEVLAIFKELVADHLPYASLTAAAQSGDLDAVREFLDAGANIEERSVGYATPPEALVLDIDHSEDAAYGQQPLAFYNHHYQSTCYLP